jgi:adenylate cyclase
MLEQVLQPLPLFLLVIIALYTIVLVVLLNKTARLTGRNATNIAKAQHGEQQSQSEATLKNIMTKQPRRCV